MSAFAKNFLITLLLAIIINGAADLAELYFGWDGQAVASPLWSFAFVWVLMDLEAERETLREVRAKVKVALDKIQGAQR